MAEKDKDQANTQFDLLCSMVDQLKEELDELNVKRDVCENCERPQKVCLCAHLPERIQLSKNIKIWIFQHPFEDKRPLRTTRILEKSLHGKNFQILKGRKFTIDRYPQLVEVYSNENTFVLYPSETSINLDEFKSLIIKSEQTDNQDSTPNPSPQIDGSKISSIFFHVIILDGTWAQASGIFYTNLDLHRLKQIKIDTDFTSAYTVRTQPREFFLSTLETVSVIISAIEDKPELYHDLVKPLKALCDFQFEHGAKPHQSKEYLIFNGLYKKPLSKKSLNFLTKNSKFSAEKSLELNS